MNDVLTVEDIAKLKKAAVNAGIRSPTTIFLSRDAYIGLRLSQDPFGIYRQRGLMRKALPAVIVYRGDEWWHQA